MLLLVLSFIFIVLGSNGFPIAEDTTVSSETNSTDAKGHVEFDQRQFGQYNIHLSIKDVNIIEMESSRNEEDIYDDTEYYYDDPQYTVQPLNYNISTASSETPQRVEKSTESQTSSATKPIAEILQESRSTQQTTESSIIRLKMQQKQENLRQMQNMKADFVQELHENSKPQPQMHSKQLIFPMRKSQQQQHQLDTNIINYPNPIIHQFQPYRCRVNQYRDLNGNCHGRRVSSNSGNSATAILRKFFNMLVGLPISNVRDSNQQ